MKPKYGDVDKSPHWRRTYEYRGIKYDIARKGTWFVLEHPEETASIAKLANEVSEDMEFLYKDSAHSWNDEQTDKQKFYEMMNCAKSDIDWFLDCSLDELAERRAESENECRELAVKLAGRLAERRAESEKEFRELAVKLAGSIERLRSDL